LVINRIPFHSLEAGALDHLDDLLLRHLDFVARFDGVTLGEFAAVGDGAVKVEPLKLTPPEPRRNRFSI
jgi:hypothetical protein